MANFDAAPIRAAVVAMSSDRVIGRDGTLPWHYSEDLKRFKRLTLGATVIMGRNTWASIGSKALPGRDNRVISHSDLENASCFRSIESALEDCAGDVWFIGGAQLYEAALTYCNFIDVTWVPDSVTGNGLVYFPNLDPSRWRDGPREPLNEDNRLINQRFFRVS